LISYLNNTYGMYIKKNLRKQELVDRYIPDPLQADTVRSSSNSDGHPFSLFLSRSSISAAFRDFRLKGELERYKASKAEFNKIAYPPRPTMGASYNGNVGYPGTSYPARAAGTGCEFQYRLSTTAVMRMKREGGQGLIE
jgi:hypothetical protein